MGDKRCRVCLCLEEYSISLRASTITGEQHLSFSDILATCCGIKISKNDGKPQNICIKCAYSARTIYDFKKRCMNSDSIVQSELDKSSKLNQYIKQEPYSEDEDSSNNNIQDTNKCCSSIETTTGKPLKTDPNICVSESSDSTDSAEILNTHKNAMEDDANQVVGDSSNNLSASAKTNIVESSKSNECFTLASKPDGSNIFRDIAQNMSMSASNSNNSPLITSTVSAEHSCKYCNFVSANDNELKRHITATHYLDKYEYCVYCNDVFYTKQELNTHINNYHYDSLPRAEYNYYQCNYCNAKFRMRASLKFHSQKHHFRPKKFRCDFVSNNKTCDKSFANKFALSQHKEQHNRNKEDKCYICHANFRSKIEMITHLRKKHQNRKCGTCKKSFTSQIALNAHMGDTQHFGLENN